MTLIKVSSSHGFILFMIFFFPLGNTCPHLSEDVNEDTISVLVRLITEKKGMCQAHASRELTHRLSRRSLLCYLLWP